MLHLECQNIRIFNDITLQVNYIIERIRANDTSKIINPFSSDFNSCHTHPMCSSRDEYNKSNSTYDKTLEKLNTRPIRELLLFYNKSRDTIYFGM